ncbi:bifunctional 3-(3-hydroxy-phenyl)propionate/3-hydroxycinnamic acid hydroxylase MhpA [Mycobacterium montefiorense]|uniref:3-(3-hydroxyphenyl)propionate hydroxylase n=1 Tax=Mycobacterium montefiorense TaxID=154654 RepID=A0AA37PKP9_9MYCO|nr:bifunctional 3-(3-hydroxy-phenyl)propionate/3-hydroxycinnamic acid hydroxylase [Mycobacterium montefiorense]GBG39207.1 3-(3-hydroxyphenyl)propionate hydroxylase [Mycobacterium montefiorense]GKU37320.1 3-(3-hydroxyphenyl)propionate hydroxylase [Mycobacterium montefiorense]GKU41968.1 3-(3-hydroxyphenyl)propionate hydroxylase [Mycobacterium montefiorense]GKU45570.1 3-(3-hydroxyphenyl)propionate hydroxylase [Mycobacterium montefiorense]GKU53468.1 3-(3-hydroxyphenyl)propionate hydroxylase [Mycob
MSVNAIRHIPVVVVGAGPTGITAATLLAQYGVDSVVLDRWPGVYAQPRAVHLDDEIYRVLARLGIADTFAAISRPTLGLRLLDNRFRVLAEFTRDTSLGRNGFPQANMFDQPELEAVLRTNLLRHPHAELRGDVEVTDVAEVGTRVRVTFTDRTDGTVHQVDADYLLGCDGANSLVRTQIGSTVKDLNFQQRWLVVDVATDADLRQWEGVHQVCDPARAGTYMRIGASRYRWEFQLRTGESADDFATLAALRPLIRPWTTGVAEGDLTLLRVTEYTFRAQIAQRWRRGNIFILGDAAHLTPPFIGQGMGAGVRDAMNLAWKIAGVYHGALAPDVLDSYEQERKPHTRHMIRLALNVARAMTGGARVGNVLRRLVLPRLRLIPGLRDKVVDSTTPALPSSALVYASCRLGCLAGTLCPNPLLHDGQRLDDVLGAGFALITTRSPGVAAAAAMRQCGVVLLVTRPGDALAQWLHGGRATAALVRPDRTVMRAGRDVAALCVWASRVVDGRFGQTLTSAGRR